MITIDFECKKQHKFEGIFKDYAAFKEQHESLKIQCPLCGTDEIKRIFTGCSIQSRRSEETKKNKISGSILDQIREFNTFVKNNFENVGDTFAEKARAIHYGIEEERNIYGKTTPSEVKELIDEGISILPVFDTDKNIN